MFIKLNEYIFKFPSALTNTELKLLLQYCFLMNYNTNMILLEPELEEQIMSRLGLGKRQYQRIKRRLIKKGFLLKCGFYYKINEDFAKKGR